MKYSNQKQKNQDQWEIDKQIEEINKNISQLNKISFSEIYSAYLNLTNRKTKECKK